MPPGLYKLCSGSTASSGRASRACHTPLFNKLVSTKMADASRGWVGITGDHLIKKDHIRIDGWDL